MTRLDAMTVALNAVWGGVPRRDAAAVLDQLSDVGWELVEQQIPGQEPLPYASPRGLPKLRHP